MQPSAVEQAEKRLAKAEKALDALKTATNLDDAEESWIDYIIAIATIYSKFEQGCKNNPKSEPWFGRKKHDRKTDPLLKYLHFARNSHEHGIQRVSGVSGRNFLPNGGRELRFNERIPVVVQQADPATGEQKGEPIKGVIAGPTLKPVRATNERFNDFADPPDTHQGQNIPYNDFAFGLAEAAIPYIREMIEEARQLVPTKQEPKRDRPTPPNP